MQKISNMDTKYTGYKFIAITFAAVGIILLGVLWFWGNVRDEAAKNNPANQGTLAPRNSDAPTNDTRTNGTPGSNTQVKNITVTTQNFSFTPAEIRVKKGDRVRLTLTDTQGFHDWVLDEFNARTKRINPGETDTIEFTVDRTGTFEYYCSVGNHRQMGMVGKLVVE